MIGCLYWHVDRLAPKPALHIVFAESYYREQEPLVETVTTTRRHSTGYVAFIHDFAWPQSSTLTNTNASQYYFRSNTERSCPDV